MNDAMLLLSVFCWALSPSSLSLPEKAEALEAVAALLRDHSTALELTELETWFARELEGGDDGRNR